MMGFFRKSSVESDDQVQQRAEEVTAKVRELRKQMERDQEDFNDALVKALQDRG